MEAVNIGQGFRVKGWFKPSINENKTTAESYSFHICYLMPRSPLTSAQSHLVHGREPGKLFIYLIICFCSAQETYDIKSKLIFTGRPMNLYSVYALLSKTDEFVLNVSLA